MNISAKLSQDQLLEILMNVYNKSETSRGMETQAVILEIEHQLKLMMGKQ